MDVERPQRQQRLVQIVGVLEVTVQEAKEEYYSNFDFENLESQSLESPQRIIFVVGGPSQLVLPPFLEVGRAAHLDEADGPIIGCEVPLKPCIGISEYTQNSRIVGR